MARDVVIRVRDLRVGYGEDVVLDRISFDIYEGEVFVILGGSGCGKSTLLKGMIGLIPPFAGQVIIDEDPLSEDEAELKRIFRKIGVLYQGAALFGSMTVAENVALPIQAYTPLSPESINLMVKMKLRLVDLDGYENHLPSELSGGMKKRAGLARAMALNPKILFFDEPSAGLDPVTSAELDALILQLNRNLGTTMVIVTHELPSIFAIAQRVVMLDRRARGIIAEGNPTYLRNHSRNEAVKRFFNRAVNNES